LLCTAAEPTYYPPALRIGILSIPNQLNERLGVGRPKTRESRALLKGRFLGLRKQVIRRRDFRGLRAFQVSWGLFPKKKIFRIASRSSGC
jgi:hypothetical protein